MKDKTKYTSMIITDVCAIVVILVCTLLVMLCCQPVKSTFSDDVTSMTDQWFTSDGMPVSLDNLPSGDLVITHSLSNVALEWKRLCFRSTDTHITAAFDGVTTYTYAPKQARILGRSYGMYIHMIPIPSDAQSVTLTLHTIYNTTVKIQNAAIEDAGVFMSDIYDHGLPELWLCALIGLFGVLMLIIGFTTRVAVAHHTVNFFSLGTFSILVGLWSANDTLILQVFTQHPEMVRFINYLCLMFIAYPPVSFMASITDHRKTPLLPVLLSLTGVNFVLTMTLSLLGISDVRLMLPFSHFNIAVAMGMTVYLMHKARKIRKLDNRFLHTVITGMSSAVAGVGLDLLRFRLPVNHLFAPSLFTRTGVLIFVLLMGLHLMRERTRIAVEQGQAELMKKMAYTDVLTGLANRAAFHLKEDEIRLGKTDCTIVQLDINYLKKVNDVHGHSEGDRHIINAAHIIRDSFAGVGTCYRTGGDEFIVVAKLCTDSEILHILEKMEQFAEAYNVQCHPPVPLQIAYGFAHCKKQTDVLEAAEKLADLRMYEKKRAMKEQEPDEQGVADVRFTPLTATDKKSLFTT